MSSRDWRDDDESVDDELHFDDENVSLCFFPTLIVVAPARRFIFFSVKDA
jgi:hypothetical protein